MIFTFLISIPAYLLSAIILVLPTGAAVPSDWVNALYTIWGYLNMFSFILPVSAMVSVLTIALVFHLAILLFKGFHWIITKIPFVG